MDLVANKVQMPILAHWYYVNVRSPIFISVQGSVNFHRHLIPPSFNKPKFSMQKEIVIINLIMDSCNHPNEVILRIINHK